MLKFKVKGIKFAQAFVIGKHFKLKQAQKVGVKKAGEFYKKEVKESIKGNRAEKRSVDTGEFLNSVDLVQDDDSVMIFSDVKQAKPLEFGTSRIPARKHFSNSEHRNKKEIQNIIESEVRQI